MSCVGLRVLALSLRILGNLSGIFYLVHTGLSRRGHAHCGSRGAFIHVLVHHRGTSAPSLLCSVCTKRGEVGWVGGAATQPTEH